MARFQSLEQRINKAIDQLIKRTHRNYEAYLWAFYRVIRKRLYELDTTREEDKDDFTV